MFCLRVFCTFLCLHITCAFGRGQAPTAAASTPQFDVAIQKDTQVPVRDGVKLALDVYRPARDGLAIEARLPTLLCRTPYNKAGVASEARWFAARGFAVVVNDVR